MISCNDMYDENKPLGPVDVAIVVWILRDLGRNHTSNLADRDFTQASPELPFPFPPSLQDKPGHA